MLYSLSKIEPLYWPVLKCAYTVLNGGKKKGSPAVVFEENGVLSTLVCESSFYQTTETKFSSDYKNWTCTMRKMYLLALLPDYSNIRLKRGTLRWDDYFHFFVINWQTFLGTLWKWVVQHMLYTYVVSGYDISSGGSSYKNWKVVRFLHVCTVQNLSNTTLFISIFY